MVIPLPVMDDPIKVEIQKNGSKYQLLRNGKPYFIKGAGGYSHIKQLQSAGGNSLRIWNYVDSKSLLDEAHESGVTIMFGLEMGRERLGFNYDDRASVEKQKQKIKTEILKYKNHPALLLWAIGNEVAYLGNNDKVWTAINDIAKLIKSIDPNHPTTTTLAGVPKDQIKNIMYKCPDVDILSINAFQDLPYVPNKIREAGWRGPYIITEWGSTGYWEVDKTIWNAVIEETSTEKASNCKTRYEASIAIDNERCLGSYIFYWGSKQERTHTFFGLFKDTGEKTSVVDMMYYLWSNRKPKNYCPSISTMTLDNKIAKENILLSPSAFYTSVVEATDIENDKLHYKWEVYHESTEYHKTGGDYEFKPDKVAGLFSEKSNSNELRFKSPAKKGAYRLFVVIYDGNNNIGTANIPFYVK